MTLPTQPTTATKTINSYLYFQYQDDQDLPALISSYNAMTQGYVSWFANVSLPVYTGLNGALLDWIGAGIYGIFRPNLSSSKVTGMIGQIASVNHHGPPVTAGRLDLETGDDLITEAGDHFHTEADPIPGAIVGPYPNIVNAIATTQIWVDKNDYDTPDDIYQRILTWWFYKGDGKNFTVPWLKRRLARFLYGTNGTDICPPWNPGISVTFNQATTPLPTCTIVLTQANLPGVDSNLLTFLKLALEGGVLLLPFQYQFVVTIA